MNQHEGVGHKDEASLLAPKRGYRRFDFSVAAHAGRNRLHRQRSRSGFKRAQEICSTTRRRVGVEHDCYPTEMGGDLFEYLQPLAPDRGLNVGESCDVSTWPRKACHESGANRIRNNHEHGGDRAGFALHRGRHGTGASKN